MKYTTLAIAFAASDVQGFRLFEKSLEVVSFGHFHENLPQCLLDQPDQMLDNVTYARKSMRAMLNSFMKGFFHDSR